MQNELTYILGAGASFQSMPIVKTFPDRFRKFASFLGNLSIDYPVRFQPMYDYSLNLFEDFKSHQSFDTYFKKLFHTNEFALIEKGKKILNLYFIWEHLQKADTESNTFIFSKSSVIDKRYDALIAGLLKPVFGKADLFCKTNFLTWNYDLNLFFSLKNYFSPNSTASEFLSDISKNDYEWNIDDQITVINMNGFFYSGYFDRFKSISKVDLRLFFLQNITDQHFESSAINLDSERIKFAWESLEFTSEKIAREKIEQSSNLVVIGYTFPLYNRLVDLKYLTSQLLNAKRLYIQDPNAIAIVEDIEDNFGIKQQATYLGDTFTKITAIENCDSFFVPNSIYQHEIFNNNSFND